MSKLEELLQGIDIEWKGFGEIASIKRGASPRPIAKYITDDEGGIPWIKIGDTSPNSKYVEKTEQRISVEGSKKSRLLKKGDFIISNSMSFGRPYILNIDGAIHDGWASISNFNDTLIADYLYHYLSSSIVQNYWISKINSGSVSNLNADIIKSLQIPIPCPDNPEKSLKIQQEIVRILDQLTETTNNLKRELVNERQIRKKQFEFYREQLFKFEEDVVEWRTLIEVASDFGRGKSKHRPRNDNKLYGGIIPFIQTGDVRNGAKEISNYTQTYNEFGLRQSKLWPKGTVCITIAANIAETSILGFNACFPDSIIGFVPNVKKTNSKYIYYLLSNYKSQLEKLGQGSAQLNINLGTFEHLKFPIPSLVEQERIVKLLDQFNTAHTAIEEEITKEIKLRTQQYEYYREKLLTFPKN